MLVGTLVTSVGAQVYPGGVGDLLGDSEGAIVIKEGSKVVEEGDEVGTSVGREG